MFDTVALFCMLSVALPKVPTCRVWAFVHVALSMVAVPVEPVKYPRLLDVFNTVAPFCMLSIPWPVLPTYSLLLFVQFAVLPVRLIVP